MAELTELIEKDIASLMDKIFKEMEKYKFFAPEDEEVEQPPPTKETMI